MSTVFLIASLALLPRPVSAQVAAKPSLTREGARRVIAGAVAEAHAKGAPGGVIAVVDDGGNLIAVERLDNTFAAGANISIGKARTAALFKKPTRFFEDVIKNGRTPMIALNDFTPLQGGVPVVVDGQVVGGVGVSGAASAQQDEELAIAGANALTITNAAQAVDYFAKDAVATSFAKGAVLLGPEHRNFQVHTSRRTAAGQAEIHEREIDIIYVQSGTATLVTGGAIVDAKVTAPDEIRGVSVDGGETREIRAGDVIVVPNGVAHWFKTVNGTIEYYVVKVAAPALAVQR
ncbi:MAG TPA: heme-binding protein [Vicinamibacterales bacterium]|nr:heme-binding protein [Vicinamibacterales bacterium]